MLRTAVGVFISFNSHINPMNFKFFHDLLPIIDTIYSYFILPYFILAEFGGQGY